MLHLHSEQDLDVLLEASQFPVDSHRIDGIFYFKRAPSAK